MTLRDRRLFYLAILLIGTLAVFTSSTMAFYTQSRTLTAQLTSAEFELRVNDSPAETQALPSIAVGPGESATREVKIDTSRLDTPTDLTVTLTAHPSGDVPKGLSISLDGATASGSSELKAVRTVSQAQDRVITMDVRVQWNAPSGVDLSVYKGFTIRYEVTVEARQVAES